MNKGIRKLLAPVASLRLTVGLFVLAMILIFLGTIAQKNHGNWTVVDTYFRSIIVWLPAGAVLDDWIQAVNTIFNLSPRFEGDLIIRIRGIEIELRELFVPFVGGYTICILMLVNLIAAHAVRFKLNWKRAGIIITHAGLILLLAGELVTGLFAVEWQMSIDEGSSANFAEDIRVAEFAVTDPTPAEHDMVVVVPQSVLVGHEADPQTGNAEPITDPKLPFDIRVLRWFPNSALAGIMSLSDPAMAANNPATEGLGTAVIAIDQPRATGVEGAAMDAPSALVELSHNGEPIGTWLVSLHAELVGDPRQPVTVGDKTYLIELRYRRDYKPYTLHLIDFRHDKFVGTEVARNFSSDIRLVDPENNVDRPVKIYMNHPLRYQGETFYQSGFFGESRTILQVVRNPGWLMPYAACTLVSLGLFVHFGVMLKTFVGRVKR